MGDAQQLQLRGYRLECLKGRRLPTQIVLQAAFLPHICGDFTYQADERLHTSQLSTNLKRQSRTIRRISSSVDFCHRSTCQLVPHALSSTLPLVGSSYTDRDL